MYFRDFQHYDIELEIFVELHFLNYLFLYIS